MRFGMPFLLENNSIEEAVQLASSLHLDFLELNLNFPACQGDLLSSHRLLSLGKRYGSGFTLHREEEPAPCSITAPVRLAWLQAAKEAIILAREAGVPIVNLHWLRGVYITLPQGRKFLYRRYREDYLHSTMEFRALCEEAAQGAVRICVENTEGWEPFQIEAIELLLQSPAFGLTLDVGHEKTAGNLDDWFYEKHADRLCHMHLHDALPNQCHMPLGTGELDIASLIRLADAAKAGAVLEIKTVSALRDSVAYLQERGLFHE